MNLVHMNGMNEHYFMDMDKRAVYFDNNHNYTLNERGARTVSVQWGSTANKRCIFRVTVASDGSRLPLFVIFKGTAEGRQTESHKHHNFIDWVQLLGTRVISIPGVFTSVWQLCDVGIMKPFTTRLVEQCQSWKVAGYTHVGGTEKIQFLVVCNCLNGLMKFGKCFRDRLLEIHSKNLDFPLK